MSLSFAENENVFLAHRFAYAVLRRHSLRWNSSGDRDHVHGMIGFQKVGQDCAGWDFNASHLSIAYDPDHVRMLAQSHEGGLDTSV